MKVFHRLIPLMVLLWLDGIDVQEIMEQPSTMRNFPPTTNIPSMPPVSSQLTSPIFPPTLVRASPPLSTTIPNAQPTDIPSTTIPGILQKSTMQVRPFTPLRTTLSRFTPSTFTTIPGPLEEHPSTTLPTSSLHPPVPVTNPPPAVTMASTTFPTPPAGTPQKGQITFDNRVVDMKVNDYDLWLYRETASKQVADACSVAYSRITDTKVVTNASGYLVVQFTIQQGYPVFTAEAIEKLKARLNTPFMRLNEHTLVASRAIFWTVDGPCPDDVCLNGGTCDVTLSNDYQCACAAGFRGKQCEYPANVSHENNQENINHENRSLFALLVLLIIPIAIALVVGFIFGRRRQQKRHLEKALDLRDVRTIGPKSMLSLPTEAGMRNEMYDSRSYALAFSDTLFSKSGPPATEDDDFLKVY